MDTKPEEIVLSWEEAELLEDEFWELRKSESRAMTKVLVAMNSGTTSEQREHEETQNAIDKMQKRMIELQDLFENALVIVPKADVLSSFRRRVVKED